MIKFYFDVTCLILFVLFFTETKKIIIDGLEKRKVHKTYIILHSRENDKSILLREEEGDLLKLFLWHLIFLS